ncbi:MAG: YbhB/YbcL family Raf kinase inhibitor-like protein [Candidatus Moranbacteria bacterium]|nr:YbhB/YbcL family Raf kinase inhibitor-like protein [Candidatus Moranbacteria bacterium]
MRIESPAFEENGFLPVAYTCDGVGVNPPLIFADVPTEARSLALIVDDPDVPKDRHPDGLFVHWVLWNIDPAITGIEENSVPQGAVEGATTRGVPGFVRACPPDREHRYFFKLYALDTPLNLPATAGKDELEKALEGHTLASATLMARYDRPVK